MPVFSETSWSDIREFNGHFYYTTPEVPEPSQFVENWCNRSTFFESHVALMHEVREWNGKAGLIIRPGGSGRVYSVGEMASGEITC